MSVFSGPEVVNNGLVLQLDASNTRSYPGSGTVWTDLSKNQMVSELVNSPTYNPAQNGYFQFQPASSTYAKIPNNTALDTQAFTIEVWVNPNSANQNGVWFEKGAFNTQYSLLQESTSIQCRIYDGSNVVNTITVPTDIYMRTTDWYQVVFTFTSGSQICYINTTVVGVGTTSAIPATNAGGMSVGAYGGYSGARGYYYDGNLSICKVYNRALTAAEIAQNFNSQCARYGINILTVDYIVADRFDSTMLDRSGAILTLR